ncbi:hypothetical protein Tco_0477985 [Tanacetum coccineum]
MESDGIHLGGDFGSDLTVRRIALEALKVAEDIIHWRCLNVLLSNLDSSSEETLYLSRHGLELGGHDVLVEEEGGWGSALGIHVIYRLVLTSVGFGGSYSAWGEFGFLVGGRNTSRWKDSNTPGKKVPKKVLRYFPIIPRLQCLYKSSHTAKDMIWHATGKCTEPEVLWEDAFSATSKLTKSADRHGRCMRCRKTSERSVLFSALCVDPPHKWRRSLEFNGQTDNTDPPKEFGRDVILAQLDRLPTRVKGKHPSHGGVKIKRNVHVELNWTKRSIFYELEYWSFLSLRHNLDIMHIEKNVLEAILNTLLMNDKSKDTAKARQDLQMLGIRSGLWLGQTKNGKCLKPQAAYSFTPENRKKFCQYIKGVKLPDGFGSCFKHKVTDNDTNITGLKSYDCHIMMQRLLAYELQNYLPDKIAKPIIDLCSLFKQICSTTLMEDDMLKAQIKVVDIMYELELIYPLALFDIMVHLVIHLPIEALEGGPIRPRWMYPFERYMKKLKGYVRNKAKPEGSIAEGYVAEEALTFSSYYFQDVTTKFNHPDRNMDPPTAMCRFQVFQSVCKPIGLRSFIRFDAQELKKVKWYVLHNSPEIDTYRSPDIETVPSQFKRVQQMSHGIHGGKGKRKPNLGGRGAGRLNTRDKTRNLSLKEIAEAKGPPECAVVLPLLGEGPEGAEGGDHFRDWGQPCLTSGRTWIPPARQRSAKASTCTCKKPTIPTRLLSRPSIERQTPTYRDLRWLRPIRRSHVPEEITAAGGIYASTLRITPSTVIDTFRRNKTKLVTGVFPKDEDAAYLWDPRLRWGFSLGIVTLTRIPQRHVAGDRFPQRHVAGENPEMLLGKTPIVVV